MIRALLISSLFATTALAGSVGSYQGCRSLKGERSACEASVGGGNFYQPGSGCGSTAGMHKSTQVGSPKLPPKPTAMPNTQKTYVTIAPGSFEIGARDEDPVKEDKDVFESKVTITRAFLIKTTEVTQAEYYFVMGAPTNSHRNECGLECPAAHLSWSAAIEYLNALSKKEGLEPCYEIKGGLAKWTKGLDCKGYRLPTKAEWEWAARGGNEAPRYGELNDVSWYQDNASGSVHPVGKKKPNAYGLGNVAEWTWDAETSTPFKGDMTDPIPGGLELENDGQSRIVRGGNYRDDGDDVRVQRRHQLTANSGDTNYGLRPVRTVK